MNDGHFFEVAPIDTAIVWEYTNPMTRDGIKKIKVDHYPTYNGVFRAYRYAADCPALIGHDLTPGATMTGDPPTYWTPDDITAIQEQSEAPSVNDDLKQNYPNPFSVGTTIGFNIAQSAEVSLVVYDLQGNYVKTLMKKHCSNGNYSIYWDGTNDGGTRVASGMYFYILMADKRKLSKKMIYNR